MQNAHMLIPLGLAILLPGVTGKLGPMAPYLRSALYSQKLSAPPSLKSPSRPNTTPPSESAFAPRCLRIAKLLLSVLFITSVLGLCVTVPWAAILTLGTWWQAVMLCSLMIMLLAGVFLGLLVVASRNAPFV
jgi:hypothetical protein